MADTVRKLVGISVAEQVTGLERTTIWRRCRAGRFPAPHYIGNLRKWYLDELERWLVLETARPAEARRGASNLKPASTTAPTGAPAA
jgi:predicted DNA-binding transcriptional regulator AlpA